jgi:hypothetical protein
MSVPALTATPTATLRWICSAGRANAAALAEGGLTDGQRADLAWFAVRVGARRLADAEYWLGQIGLASAAAIAGRQAGWWAGSSTRLSSATTPRSLLPSASSPRPTTSWRRH